MRREIAAVFTVLFVVVLGFGGAYRALAQSTCSTDPDTCADQGDGNGQGGGAGGGGGGMSSGGDSGNQPGQPGGTGGTSGGGSSGTGGGGNGSNGGAGGNVDARKTPEPTAAPDSGGGSGTGTRTSASSTSPHATDAAGGFTDDRLATWAQQLSTNPDEVKSWFGTYTANDSLGGAAAVLVVHAEDDVTVFDGATANDAGATSGNGNVSDGTGDGGALRSGVKGIGDSSNKGGDDVEINLHSQAVALGTTVTQVGGRFSAAVHIPKSTSAGRHFIVALVPNTSQGRSAFVFPVTVADAAAAAPAGDTTRPVGSPKHFPWVLVELLVGTASVVGLFVVRVRRATAGRA